MHEKARGIKHLMIEFLVDERGVKDFPDICGMLGMFLCLLSDIIRIGIYGGIGQWLDDEEHDFEKLCEEEANTRGHANSVSDAGQEVGYGGGGRFGQAGAHAHGLEGFSRGIFECDACAAGLYFFP